MEGLREKIVEVFSHMEVYAILLDDAEAYLAGNYEVLVEKSRNDILTLYVFSNREVQDVDEIKVGKTSLDDAVYVFLRDKYNVRRHFSKLPLINKLLLLFEAASLILIIRHREETRGGELIELALAGEKGYANKIWFLKKEGINLSTMVEEYLDLKLINMRSYQKIEELVNEAIRIISYEIQRRVG